MSRIGSASHAKIIGAAICCRDVVDLTDKLLITPVNQNFSSAVYLSHAAIGG